VPAPGISDLRRWSLCLRLFLGGRLASLPAAPTAQQLLLCDAQELLSSGSIPSRLGTFSLTTVAFLLANSAKWAGEDEERLQLEHRLTAAVLEQAVAAKSERPAFPLACLPACLPAWPSCVPALDTPAWLAA